METPPFDMTGAIKCPHCDEGYRHPVGNCVLCGWGPAPGAIENKPTTKEGKALALAELAMEIARDMRDSPELYAHLLRR